MPRCLHCKTKFEPRTFLAKYCLQSDECISAFRIYANEKVKKQKEKNWRVEKKELKEKLKTKSDFEKDLQIEINTIVREIDKGWPCIATKATTGKVNAGHYVGTLANPTIRFHLENIWLQSEHSNTWKSGDTIRYQQGIVALFGVEYLDYMNNLQSFPPLKLTIDDIKEKIPIARSIIKWIRLQDRKFSLEERISLRKEFNNQLKIYPQ